MKKRRVNPLAFLTAMKAVKKLPEAERERLRSEWERAFSAFKTGRGDHQAWATLTGWIDTGIAVSKAGICSDEGSRARLDGGYDAIGRIYQRQRMTGQWLMGDVEMSAIDEALWVCGVQLEHVSLREMIDAKKAVRRRYEQALAGNAPPGVNVFA